MQISHDEIREIIKNVASSVDVAKIDPNTKLREYGVDSLDFFDIVLQLQEKLGREISDEEVDELRTLNSIQSFFLKDSN
ncbi:acyl carrier protein [Pigmentiphaga kullae]|uniref:Acyl carrier protein n=1 Tax=Pigmentiphaga kullae TaxID=151784 RepID=A0A4Q7NM72_9BURK|nr:acyl carrier protein [Pigmentiphaga kullae]RZS85976.1 acyl carrier protein [Pigmentiphaga kullae]